VTPSTTGPVSAELLLVDSGRPTVVTGQYDDLIGQLPKCCRRKSTTIISYLSDLKLDSNLRVVYEGGEQGGHLAGERDDPHTIIIIIINN
jgi:hypothetical protein